MGMPFTKTIEERVEELEQFRRLLASDEEERKILQGLLDTFEFDGWEHFRQEVLQSRMDRNAHRGMNLDEAEAVDEQTEQRMRDRLQGQYNEDRFLCQEPDQIRARIQTISARIETYRERIAEATQVLEKHETRSN